MKCRKKLNINFKNHLIKFSKSNTFPKKRDKWKKRERQRMRETENERDKQNQFQNGNCSKGACFVKKQYINKTKNNFLLTFD